MTILQVRLSHFVEKNYFRLTSGLFPHPYAIQNRMSDISFSCFFLCQINNRSVLSIQGNVGGQRTREGQERQKPSMLTLLEGARESSAKQNQRALESILWL